MARKSGMDFEVPRAARPQGGEIQDLLLQHAQQSVIGFGAGAVELVVDQGVPVGARRGQPIVHPEGVHVLFRLQHGMDVVVDQLGFAVTRVLADQVRAAKLIVPVNQSDRTAEFGRHVEGQRGFSGSRRAGKVHRITNFQVGERPFGQGLNVRGRHELLHWPRAPHRPPVAGLERPLPRGLLLIVSTIGMLTFEPAGISASSIP
jgi:hypothetical protein